MRSLQLPVVKRFQIYYYLNDLKGRVFALPFILNFLMRCIFARDKDVDMEGEKWYETLDESFGFHHR